MKLLCTGDFHIKRKHIPELKSVFFQILNKLEKCDGIFIAGDIFDTDCPKPDEIDFFIDFIKRMPKHITIYLIGGNHGVEQKGISAEMWIRRIGKNIVYDESLLLLDINNFKIRVEHINCSESKFGAHNFQKAGVSYKSFKEDIVILGHIHKPQVLSKKPLVVHPGSPFAIHFGEQLDSKGVGILDITDQIKYTHEHLEYVPMKQIDINEKDLDTLEEQLKQIPERTKLKVVFNINKLSLINMDKINDILKKYKNNYYEFKSSFNFTDTKHEIEKDVKQENINTLFDKFCKIEDIDNTLQNTIRELLK